MRRGSEIHVSLIQRNPFVVAKGVLIVFRHPEPRRSPKDSMSPLDCIATVCSPSLIIDRAHWRSRIYARVCPRRIKGIINGWNKVRSKEVNLSKSISFGKPSGQIWRRLQMVHHDLFKEVGERMWLMERILIDVRDSLVGSCNIHECVDRINLFSLQTSLSRWLWNLLDTRT